MSLHGWKMTHGLYVNVRFYCYNCGILIPNETHAGDKKMHNMAEVGIKKKKESLKDVVELFTPFIFVPKLEYLYYMEDRMIVCEAVSCGAF